MTRRTFAACLRIALAAAALGGFFAMIAYTGHAVLHGRAGPMPELETASRLMFIIWAISLMIGIPTSLAIGAPLLWLLQRPLVRRPIAGATLLASIGILLAMPLHLWINLDGMNPERSIGVGMLLGGCVAGTAAILLIHLIKRKWRVTLNAALLSFLLASMLGRVILDLWQNNQALQHYAFYCDGNNVDVLEPSLVGTLAHSVRSERLRHEITPWYEHEVDPALLSRRKKISVDGVRTLMANDVVYAPVTPWSRLGFPRAVQAQCLPSQSGRAAVLARAMGLVTPFRWSDVAR